MEVIVITDSTIEIKYWSLAIRNSSWSSLSVYLTRMYYIVTWNKHDLLSCIFLLFCAIPTWHFRSINMKTLTSITKTISNWHGGYIPLYESLFMRPLECILDQVLHSFSPNDFLRKHIRSLCGIICIP